MFRKPIVINEKNKIEECYKETLSFLETHPELEEKIAKFLWAYHEIGSLIPQTVENFGSGHYFPYSESYYELENSYQFCLCGFYRYSFVALRSTLELGILGIFYDKENQAYHEIQEWIRSNDPTPRFKSILDELFKVEKFKEFNSEFLFKEEILKLYGIFSNFVHSRGVLFSSTGQSKSNFNRFNKKSFNSYVNVMSQIVQNLCTMFLIKYPIGMRRLPLWEKFGFDTPIGGFLENDSSQKLIFSLLPQKHVDFLIEMSNNDSNVRSIIESIGAMPDLTEEELGKQGKDLDIFISKMKNSESKH